MAKKLSISLCPLDGSEHNYWSVTMYDGKTQLLIENPIKRYLINSPMLPSLKKKRDGSLTIYIQKDAPAADKKSNWLPAPDGPIYMVMGLYWPKEPPAPSILPPATAHGNHQPSWWRSKNRGGSRWAARIFRRKA